MGYQLVILSGEEQRIQSEGSETIQTKGDKFAEKGQLFYETRLGFLGELISSP